MSVLILIGGIVLFILLIVVHEFGHFIVATRNGVEAKEFGIFFPPRLYSRKTKKGWIFSVNLLPLGGFVSLKGEHDSDTEPGSFGAASVWVKSKIMAAGVVMNIATALVLFTLLALIGMPKVLNNQYTIKSNTKLTSSSVPITGVETGSPAAKAGLKAGDQIVAIHQPGKSNSTIITYSNLPDITKHYAGKTVDVVIKRDSKTITKEITLLSSNVINASIKAHHVKGYLGVGLLPITYQLQRSTWSAPIVAVGLSVQLTGTMFQGLGHAIGGLGSIIAGTATGNKAARQNGQSSASQDIVGPVGLYAILKILSTVSYQYVLFIITYISLALGIFNLLPIPALDGGRLWLSLFMRAIKKPLTAKREEIINATGLVVLLGLSIVIAIVNVKQYF